MYEAAGMLEVYGLTAAFMAADAGCKAADVTLELFDKNRPMDPTLKVPLLIMVKFRGKIEDVTAAMEAAKEAAIKVSDAIFAEHIIAAPTEDTEKMLKITAL